MTDDNSDESACVDHVVALFDRLLREERYLLADMVLLERMNQNIDSPAGVLAILTLTFYAKHHLKKRDTYLHWAESNMRHSLGDKRANDLLKNRR